MTMIRRRWSDRELVEASRRGASRSCVPLDDAHCRELMSPLVPRIESWDRGALRGSLTGAVDVAMLAALSASMQREIGIVRRAHGPLFLVVGSERHVPLEAGELLLVHTHLADLPPSVADVEQVRAAGANTVASIVGPDGRVSDYTAGGLAPDAEWSPVSDDGRVDGRLHRVYAKPRPLWRARENAAPAMPVPPRVPLFRAIARLANLGSHAIRLSFALLAAWLAKPIVARPRRMRWIGRRVAEHLAAMGPLWVKLGQVASARPDLLPPDVIDALAGLRKHANPRVAPRRLPARFAGIVAPDSMPLWSGSVADVFHGALPNGDAVAIKAVRAEARRTIEEDLRLLRTLMRLVQRVPFARDLPMIELVSEIEIAARGQCELAAEARQAVAFRERFHGGGVAIPAVYGALSDGDALVLEYFDALHAIDGLALDTAQRASAARNLVRLLFRMIFDAGRVHIDLHPGNLLFRTDGTIVLLDFGLVAELDATARNDFADLFFGMATGDGAEVARVLYETALARPEDLDTAAFANAVETVVAEHHGRRAGDFAVAAFVLDLMRTMHRHRLRSSVAFTRVLGGLVTVEGIVRQLDPRLDFQREASIVISSVRAREQPDPRLASTRASGVRGARRA